MLELSDKWIELVIGKEETGMGYHVVSIVLKDGTRYDQVIIDSGYVTRIRGRKDLPFENDDIAEIIVTHDKWRFQQG